MSERLKHTDSELQRRMDYISTSEEAQRGLMLVSRVGMVAEKVLYDNKIPNLWLPPIDTSIREYSDNDFIVVNPLNSKRYSLIQSPQIMKEIAALAFGSNWRRTTCFRPEPGDATHAQMFQQIDVELRDANGKQARELAGEMFIKVTNKVLGASQLHIPEYDYQTMVDLYGYENPNLHKGPLLDYLDGNPVLRVKIPQEGELTEIDQLIKIHNPDAQIHVPTGDHHLQIHGELEPNEIVVVSDLFQLRDLRESLIDKIRNDPTHPVFAYWLVNLPFASVGKDGVIKPTHHVMSLPYAAISNPDFSFFDCTDEELTRLRCDSYDLVLCNDGSAIEIAGGDVRIPIASLQRQAIDRLDHKREMYAVLLEALEVNESQEVPHSLVGFAVGVERLAMTLGQIDRIDNVQIFPTNSPTGDFIHAAGYK